MAGESRKSQLETEAAELDIAIRKVELRIKELEISDRSRWWKAVLTSPLLIAAMITAFATWAASQLTAANAQAQREGQLIIDAIKTGDVAQARENLHFLVTSGLIEDPDGRLQGYLRQLPTAAVPPPAAAQPIEAAKDIKTDDAEGENTESRRIAASRQNRQPARRRSVQTDGDAPLVHVKGRATPPNQAVTQVDLRNEFTGQVTEPPPSQGRVLPPEK